MRRYAHPVPSRPQQPARRPARWRLAALALLLGAVAMGLGIHYGLPAGTASDVSGDILYAASAYLGIVVLAPRLRPATVGAVAAAWCVLIELFQLTGIPLALGAAFPPAMLVLGTVFDGRDIVLYLGTAAVLTLIDAAVSRSVARRVAAHSRSPRTRS